jgi:hypothetical protein
MSKAEVIKHEPEAPMPAQVSETGAVLSMIERAARDPAVDIDKMERLMRMHTDMVSRAAEQKFNTAMRAAQEKMKRVAADKDNSQTRSQYASYAALDRAVRPIYTAEGFALSFDSGDNAPEDCVRVVCFVSHTDGYTRKYHADIPADGKGAKGGDVMTKTHAAGAAFTYGQRYLLKMIFNIAIGEDDDDGNSATAKQTIDAEQAQNLRDMIAAAKASEAKFLKWAKVKRIEDIAVDLYDSCVEAIQNVSKARRAS